MQRIFLKIFIIIILFILIISIFSINVFGSWVDDADNFLKKSDGTVGVNETELKSASSEIYNMLTSIGMIISVIVGLILGIIYMMSSAVDKAKVKESILPFLIGSAVIFGAFGIWKLVINTLSGI